MVKVGIRFFKRKKKKVGITHLYIIIYNFCIVFNYIVLKLGAPSLVAKGPYQSIYNFQWNYFAYLS